MLRAWLKTHYRDGLAWSDLARVLAAKGNSIGANKAMSAALALHPNSRLILRNATRLFLHDGEHDRALNLLQRHERTKVDPWLMAGHIAVSSILGRESRFIKPGRQIVASGNLAPTDVSELASSIATVELQSGSNKSAKKLFNTSLVAPNENSLAQVEWASRQLRIVPDLPADWLIGPNSAEAGYYRAITDGDFATALQRSIDWYRHEPFASRPVIAASFLSSILGRQTEAADFAKLGLSAEPNNITLINNLLFAKANDGAFEETDELVRRIWSIEKENPSAQTLANFGMLCYMDGDFDTGTLLYEVALTRYKRSNQPDQIVNSQTFHAYYAELSHAPDAQVLKQKALLAVQTASSLCKAIYHRLFASNVTALVPPTVRRAATNRWHYDLARNTLTLEKRLPVK